MLKSQVSKKSQQLREPNRIYQLDAHAAKERQFVSVIFTDECLVVMENHSKITFHDMWEQPKVKGQPKHPWKVQAWTEVSQTLQFTIFPVLWPKLG